VLAPKAVGAWNLHELTENHRLDAFVLFSSAASLVGWPGQANYASANAILDALAHHRRRRGLPSLAVNWGAWAGVGMAARLADADQERLGRRGLRWLQPEDALLAFEGASATGLAQVGVLSIDWATFAGATSSTSIRRLLSDVVAPTAAQGELSRDETPTLDLGAEVLAAPAPRRRALLSARVRDLVVRTLGLPAGFILDPRQGLRSIGLDSLMAVELRNTLQKALGRPLPSTLLFDFPTVEALSGYLLGTVSERPEKDEGRSAVHGDSVVDLSADEAEDLLKAELTQIRTERREEDR